MSHQIANHIATTGFYQCITAQALAQDHIIVLVREKNIKKLQEN
jgi:hypothetical protein